MGDGEDLAALGEALELGPKGRGLGAADAGVHLVEDQRRMGLLGLSPCRELQGEMDAGELASRGDPGKRPRLLARVRREEKDHLIDAFTAELHLLAAEDERATRPAPALQRHREARPGEAQVLE